MNTGLRMFVGMLGFLALASPAYSAGFALIEQSASGLGNAYAGGAAVAEDATTVFFNPAGLTRIKGQQAVLGAHLIVPQAEFSNEGSTHVTGQPLSGGDGGDGGKAGVAPIFYYASQLGNGWAVGLGVNAPFGLATEYDDGWVGRYHALRSEVKTVNINPSVAYRLNDHLSLGAGVSAQYFQAELSNAIDFGTIAFQQSGGLLGVPQGMDGTAELEADSWGFGYNLGALYEFDENSRVGLAYRSQVRQDLEGDADFIVPSSVSSLPIVGPGVAATFADTDVSGDLVLPESVSLSGYHSIGSKWAVMADVTWTNWSRFDELRIKFDQNANGITLSDSVTTEDWEDSWRYSVGVAYNPSENWLLRAGAAYDVEPIPDTEHRTPRIPGDDRIWAAFGVGYRLNDRFSFDIGYAHLFVDDPEIDKDPNGEDAPRGGLKGTYDASVDIVGVQVAYNF